jgi:hypothetical protein
MNLGIAQYGIAVASFRAGAGGRLKLAEGF